MLIYELCFRLKDHQDTNLLSMFNIVHPLELPVLQRRRERPDLFFPGFDEGNTQQVQTFVIPRGHPSRLPAEPAASLFEAILCFDRYEAAVMRYPNFEVSRSRSRLLEAGLVSDEHRQVAEAVRQAILESDELTADATYLRLIGNDATHEALQRWKDFLPQRLRQLSPPQRETVERAQRLRAYLTTPFFATQEAFEMPGQWVDVSDMLRDCRAILDGAYDGVTADKLMNIGSLEAVG